MFKKDGIKHVDKVFSKFGSTIETLKKGITLIEDTEKDNHNKIKKIETHNVKLSESKKKASALVYNLQSLLKV